MPRTTYAPSPQVQQQGQSSGDSRLQELAALAQIFSGLNSAGERTQQNQQQNQLSALALILQQQHQQAQLAQASQFNQGDQAYRSGMLEHENARDAMAATNEAARNAMENTWHQQAVAEQVFNTMAQNPQTLPSQYPAMIKALNLTGGDELIKNAQENSANQHVARLIPQLSLIYSGYNNDPTKHHQALSTLWQTDPGLQDPLVQQKLAGFLQQQNVGLAQPTVNGQAPINSSDVPASLMPQFQAMQQAQQVQQAQQTQQAQQAAQAQKRAQVQQYIYSNNPDYLPSQY